MQRIKKKERCFSKNRQNKDVMQKHICTCPTKAGVSSLRFLSKATPQWRAHATIPWSATWSELTSFTGVFLNAERYWDTSSNTRITFCFYRKRNWVTLRPCGLHKGISELKAWYGALNSSFSPWIPPLSFPFLPQLMSDSRRWPTDSQGLNWFVFPIRQHKVFQTFWVPRSNKLHFSILKHQENAKVIISRSPM